MSKQPPPAPTASAVGPCPTAMQIVGRPGTGSLPSTITPASKKCGGGIGWLIWVKWPFETVFQSISGRLPERGRKRRERIEASKNVKTTPPAPYASTVGPCPTLIQMSRD